MRYIPSRISEIQDFLSYMVLSCPDFFEPDEEMDCASAFATLREGLKLVGDRLGEERSQVLANMATEAEGLYESGDAKGGGFRLQDMKDYLKSDSK